MRVSIECADVAGLKVPDLLMSYICMSEIKIAHLAPSRLFSSSWDSNEWMTKAIVTNPRLEVLHLEASITYRGLDRNASFPVPESGRDQTMPALTELRLVNYYWPTHNPGPSIHWDWTKIKCLS